MKYYISFLIYILLFININYYNVNGQITLTPTATGGPVTAPPEFEVMNGNDRNCVATLISSLGLSGTFNPSSSTDYCSSYPNNFVCNATTGYLMSFNITGTGQGFLDSGMNVNFNSLRCFLNSPFPIGVFSNIKVQTGFWSTNITLSEIVLDSCVFEALSTVQYFRGALTIYPKSLNAFTTLNLYMFKNLKKFIFINYYNLPSSNYNYILSNVVDLTAQEVTPDLIKVQVTSFSTAGASTFSNFQIKRLELISSNFITSDGGNYIQTMTLIEELALTTLSNAYLPTGLFSTPNNGIFKKIQLDFKLSSDDTQLINLNNFPTVETFIMNNPTTLLTSSNQYKISSFGNVKTLVINSTTSTDANTFLQLLSKIESLTITNSQFSQVDLSSILALPLLKNLYLASNTLMTGNLDNQVCTLSSVVVKDCGFGGSLPSCLYCYLNSSNQDFRGNSFTNYNQYSSYQVPECTSIIPKLSMHANNKLYLEGTDLGFSTDAFYTDPKIDFILETPSTSFYTNQAVSGLVKVYFKIPNKNFTLDTSQSPPKVDSIIVSPLELNGVLTINGSYFSYDVSSITVTVGSENCNIISSTFYQIKCQVNNYDPSILNIESSITVGTAFINDLLISLTPGLTNLYKTCSQNCALNYQCSRFTGTCIPIISIQSMTQNIISLSNIEMRIKGSFGDTQGDLAIYFNSVSCNIKSFSTGVVVCSVPYSSESSIRVYAIQNGYQADYLNGFNFVLNNCPNDCTDASHGNCNYNNGTCLCVSPYGGLECNYQYPKVSSVLPSNENGGEFIIKGVFGLIGSVFKVYIGSKEVAVSVKNDTTIIGTAEPGIGTFSLTISNNNLNYTSETGYTYTFDCLSIGGCNNGKCVHMNQCACNTDYYGSVCLLKQHYVSSLIPTTINGGTVLAFGDFGNDHLNLQVLVGTEICDNPSINSTTIECLIGPGTGLKSFTVKQNDLIWTSNNFFNYINPIKSCPSNCTSSINGKCDTSSGVCQCSSEWSAFDCSLPINNNNNNNSSGGGNSEPIPTSTSTIDIETGIAQIQNQNTKFNISIIKILELSITDQSIVSEFKLKQVWDSYESKTTSDGNNLYIFNQSLSTENSNIIYKIEEVKKSKSFNFADINYQVPDDSIKITIEINNYPFSSVLNVLQLQMESLVESQTSDTSSCNQKDSTSEIQDGNDLASFIKISINKKVLYGRLVLKILSNNRPTFISSDVISKTSDSVILGLNLPHCDDSCIIDPDFSLLVESDFKNSCDDSSNKTAIIAIAVVVPVVVISALIIGGAIYYKKNRINIKVKTMKLRTFK